MKVRVELDVAERRRGRRQRGLCQVKIDVRQNVPWVDAENRTRNGEVISKIDPGHVHCANFFKMAWLRSRLLRSRS